MDVGIGKLGLPSIAIPDLFLAERISQWPTDWSGTPTPPISPPPPGLVHPSSPRTIGPTIALQDVRGGFFSPALGEITPGIFDRIVVDGASRCKSAIRGKVLGGGADPDGVIIGGSGHGSPSMIGPKIVELIKSLRSPGKRN